MDRKKYPRTKNLPFSNSNSSDDVWWKDCSAFEGKEVIISEKLDGECVHEGTLLDTNKGKTKIEDICRSPNEFKILGMNLNTLETDYQDITETMVIQSEKKWFLVEIENGIELKLTGDHLVWLPKMNCYRRIDELKEGDEFILKN